MFITGTVDKTHLLVIPENEAELLNNVLPWTLDKLAKQYLILLLETVKFWGIDLLRDVEIEIESKLEDLEIKGCSELFTFKLLSREEKLPAITVKVEDLLKLGLLCLFKSSTKLGKELFADKSCLQKVCVEEVAQSLHFLHSCELTNLLLLFTLFFSEQNISGTYWLCLDGYGGTVLLLQNNKWIVYESKEGNYLSLMSWLKIILYFKKHHNFYNSNKHKQTEDKTSTRKKTDHLNGLEILNASSFTSSILVLPESRAPCKTDNANKVSALLNTPELLFMNFRKDGCLA